ncbi:MAG: DinB family protein [Cyclobacteriaceae bacterium]
MNLVEILARQTEDAYEWGHRLIDTIPYQHWDTIPEVVETSVSWQVGHLTISYYFHTIMTTVGHQMDILKEVPVKAYSELYNIASPQNAPGKATPPELRQHLTTIEKRSLEVIRSLSPEDLKSKLEPTQTPHPVANTKYEALDWNIKHTMWHCGQLGMLKRIVHERYDFGLRKAD